MSKQFSFKRISRRNFVKTTGAAAAATFGFQYVPSNVWGVNSKPSIAGIGAGGKGRVDLQGSDKAGFQVVALSDVVDVRKMAAGFANTNRKYRSMEDVRNRYSGTEFYKDYRVLIEEMGDKIDAVTVSTPDHHHFHASALAMQAGKHVYCQKPLTHGIWEARKLTEIANLTQCRSHPIHSEHASSTPIQLFERCSKTDSSLAHRAPQFHC